MILVQVKIVNEGIFFEDGYNYKEFNSSVDFCNWLIDNTDEDYLYDVLAEEKYNSEDGSFTLDHFDLVDYKDQGSFSIQIIDSPEDRIDWESYM